MAKESEYLRAIRELDEFHAQGQIDDEKWKALRAKLLVEGTKGSHADAIAGAFVKSVGFVVVAVVVVVFILLVKSCSSSSPGSDHTNMNISAQETCKESVKKQLKSPSSAKFSNVQTVSTGGDSYSVSGDVDSQNSFGAMVRSSWTCTFDGNYGRATITGGD